MELVGLEGELRPRLGDRIQSSLHFIYLTCHILWITAILLGLLLRQAQFYISAGFAFRCFSRFYFDFRIHGRPLPFYGICSLHFLVHMSSPWDWLALGLDI